jgi:hypothetical protein
MGWQQDPTNRMLQRILENYSRLQNRNTGLNNPLEAAWSLSRAGRDDCDNLQTHVEVV